MSTVVLQGDALAVLKRLPAESIHCVVTSPPYWGLRDYGVAGQIGVERTPEEYVARLVAVFREVRRALRDDGSCWVNLGDSYAKGRRAKACPGGGGLRPKDLIGIPWRVAFALQADGWILRSDIIWHKRNPMPESVRDRPTKSHEYIFLLTKSRRYHYDANAIKEPASPNTHDRTRKLRADPDQKTAPTALRNGMRAPGVNPKCVEPGKGIKQNTGFSADVVHRVPFRNRRTVWSLATQPFPGAHFATFPPKLIEPCILAGCPPGGVVLDPFGGAGTTAVVAEEHGRDAILIELSKPYIRMIRERLNPRKRAIAA